MDNIDELLDNIDISDVDPEEIEGLDDIVDDGSDDESLELEGNEEGFDALDGDFVEDTDGLEFADGDDIDGEILDADEVDELLGEISDDEVVE